MTRAAKKKHDAKIKKPEVMEQNRDASLEYSSEEEKEGLDEMNEKRRGRKVL